jgi:hypothetical protein
MNIDRQSMLKIQSTLLIKELTPTLFSPIAGVSGTPQSSGAKSVGVKFF